MNRCSVISILQNATYDVLFELETVHGVHQFEHTAEKDREM